MQSGAPQTPKQPEKKDEKNLLQQFTSTVKKVAAAVTDHRTSTTITSTTSGSSTSSSPVSLAASSSSTQEETHSLGLIALGKIAKVFYNNKDDLSDQVKPIKDFFDRLSKKAKKLNSEFKKELVHLYPPEDEKSQQGKKKIELFVTHLFALVDDLTHLFKPTANIDATQETNKIVKQIKSLLNEFESLNLEAMFNQYVPDSWKQMKAAMQKKIVDEAKEWIVTLETKANELEAEMKQAYIQAGNELSVEQFQKLSHPIQDSILLSMEGMLKVYQEFILMLDKMEVQFGFREGALLKMLKNDYPEHEMKIEVVEDTPIKIPGKNPEEALEKSNDKKPTDYTKTIISKFETLTNHYDILIKARGFAPVELLPYSFSKHQARIKLQDKILQDLNTKLIEYKDLTKNIRVAVTQNLQARRILDAVDFIQLKFKEEVLPDEIKTSDEAGKWKIELTNQFNLLNDITKKMKTGINKTDTKALEIYQGNKKAILEHHKKAIALMRDLEFYLLEKERIEKIIKHSPARLVETPSRQVQPAETMKLFKEQCIKIIDNAKPYLNHQSKERKQLSGFKFELQEKLKIAKELFDPIFVEHARLQFEAEKAEAERIAAEKAEEKRIADKKAKAEKRAAKKEKTERPAAEPELKVVETPSSHLEEKKQVSPEPVTPNSESVKIKDPFAHFSHQLLIVIFRALDSVDVVLKLAASKNLQSKATSPSEALAEDLAKANTILGHVNHAKDTFLEFSSYMQSAFWDEKPEQLADPVLVPEFDEEKKHELPQSEDAVVPVDSKRSIMAQFRKNSSKKLDEKISILTKYLNEFKKSGFGLDLYTKNLILEIVDDLKDIAPKFRASYLNYLAPPTKATHALVAVRNIGTLIRLINNLDKLSDVVSGNSIIIPLTVLYHINHCLKELFVLVDEIEIFCHLKQGAIFEKLKELSKNKFDTLYLMETIQNKLNGFQYAVVPEDRYPYTDAIRQNRGKILESNDSSNLVKDIVTSRMMQLPELKDDDSKIAPSKKRMVELDLHINKLKAKRNGWFLSRKNLEKRIIRLEEFRHILRKEGYTQKNTAKESTDPKWKALLSTDKVLMDRLDRIECETPENQKMKKQIRLPKLQSKHPIEMNDPIIQKIKTRMSELRSRRFKTSNNISKQVLLHSLLDIISKNKISFKNALERVKQQYPDIAYLLYDGETGKKIQEIENQTGKSRMIKSAIESCQLHFLSSNQRAKEQAAADIQLLKQIQTNPDANLSADDQIQLKRVVPGLLPRHNRS